MKKQILIVEDSPEYLQIIQTAVSKMYNVILASDGASAFSAIRKNKIDLVLLDVVLPDMNGYQICNFIKSQPIYKNIPVIFITGNDKLEEKLEGFEYGGDDYLTKPFHHKELLARIAVNLRKLNPQNETSLILGGLKIETQKQLVTKINDNSSVDLTRIEFKLLVCFARHPDWILSRDKILERVWPDKVNVSDRTVDSHISNLRKKLKSTYIMIEAVHGSGYRLKLVNQKLVA